MSRCPRRRCPMIPPPSGSRWARVLDRMEPDHRPIRNPLEFCFAVVLGASVAPAAVGPAALPPSLLDLPDYVGAVSAVLLLLGCIGLAMGIVWRNRDTGIVIQQTAMWFVAPSLTMYGLAVGANTGWSSQGAWAVGLSLGLAVGFFARIAQIQLWVRRRRRLAASLPDLPPDPL